MRLQLNHFLYILLFALSVSHVSLAQTKLSSAALEAYDARDFETALILYGDVLKSYPTNAIYNHRYGVCLFETNSNIDLAEKHLKTSSSKGIRLSNYYLGKVYLKKYEFNRAKEYLEAYSRYLRPSDERQGIVRHELDLCTKGLQMLEKTEKLSIIDTLIVPKKRFSTYYDISTEAGSYSHKDFDNNSISDSLYVLFLTERKDRCYYSTLDAKGENRDIATRERLLDEWSSEIRLSGSVNSDQNEIFPFVSSDGMTLYFSSENHNGFGGYDIFVTRYNPSTKLFLPPKALGMPFNSPGNDYFYVIDEARNIGWFASDRHNKKDEITIYKFIPRKNPEYISTEDPISLRKAALLKEFNFDNSNVVFMTTKTAKKQKEIRDKDQLHFILNDSIIYHSLGDFVSLEARASYKSYLKLIAQSDSVSQLMTEKREAFARTTIETERKEIADNIMDLETTHFSLKEQISNVEKETRKLEWEIIHGQLVNTDDDHDAPWNDPPLEIKIPKVIVPTFFNKELDNTYKEIFNLIEIKDLQAAEEKKLEADNLVLKWQESLQELGVDKTESPQSVFSELIHRDTAFTQELTKAELAKQAAYRRNLSTVRYSESYTLRYHTLLDKVETYALSLPESTIKTELHRIMREAKFNYYDAGPLNNPKNSFDHYNFDQVREALGKLEKANDFLEKAVMLSFKYKVENGLSKASKMAYDTLIQNKDEDPAGLNDSKLNSKTLPKEKGQNADLFYRVQIGLYRNKPKEDLIKKIPPVTFEIMEGQNLKRYYSGYYTNKQEAIEVAMELDAIGFPGAFVVPFVKGKKSTWADVKEYLKSK